MDLPCYKLNYLIQVQLIHSPVILSLCVYTLGTFITTNSALKVSLVMIWTYLIFLPQVIFSKNFLIRAYQPALVYKTCLFLNRLCTSIPTGLYGAGSTGYLVFLQNRNIKGELARASVFVFLKGTTARTGFLGWRDESGEGVGRSHSPCSSLILLFITLSPSDSVSLKPSLKQRREISEHRGTTPKVAGCMRWVPFIKTVNACRPR